MRRWCPVPDKSIFGFAGGWFRDSQIPVVRDSQYPTVPLTPISHLCIAAAHPLPDQSSADWSTSAGGRKDDDKRHYVAPRADCGPGKEPPQHECGMEDGTGSRWVRRRREILQRYGSHVGWFAGNPGFEGRPGVRLVSDVVQKGKDKTSGEAPSEEDKRVLGSRRKLQGDGHVV